MLEIFFSLLTTCLSTSLADSTFGSVNSANESSIHMKSKLWCPTFIVGTICPDHTLFSYYKCCGRLHKHCCSHLRLWVLILIIGLPILFLIPPIIYLLRRILCKQQYARSELPTTVSAPLQETSKDTSL